MPTAEEVSLYKYITTILPGAFYAVADGLKLLLEQCGDAVIQEMFYNHRTHDQYIRTVFLIAPSGAVIACVVNVPGNMHDSETAEF